MNYKINKSRNKAFTMVELLVVATVIALLAAIGAISYSSFMKQSRDSKRKSDLEKIRSALEMYRSDNDYYPGSLPTLTPYIPVTPSDPKSGYTYNYCPVGVAPNYTNYSICSYLESPGRTVKTCCSNCGDTCYYKLSPLGEE
jgi:prepilin-type N-terminal cleavage/methylation domain-containing protein